MIPTVEQNIEFAIQEEWFNLRWALVSYRGLANLEVRAISRAENYTMEVMSRTSCE